MATSQDCPSLIAKQSDRFLVEASKACVNRLHVQAGLAEGRTKGQIPSTTVSSMPDEGYEIRCNNCRSPVSSKAVSCPHCGAVLQDRVNRALEPQPSALLGSVASGPTSTGLRTWESPPPPPPLSLPSLGSAHFSYGGFWIRTLAALIDSLILGVAAFFLRPRLGEIAPLITLVGNWLYFSLMESSGSQATVGKVVCGLRVTDTQGQRISFGRATGRYFAKILSALTLFIGYPMVGWTRQKRGLHDFIAGTLVVRA